MVTRNDLKHIKSLHRKKGRRESGLFIVEGEKGVEEVLSSGLKVQRVYVTSDSINKMAHNSQFVEVSNKDMERMTALTHPSPVLAVVEIPRRGGPDWGQLRAQRVLMIDEIRDPGNLGTMIRTADWFGIRNVLLSEQCVDLFNPKVVQATMGSLFRVSIYTVDLMEAVKALESGDHPIMAAVMDGDGMEPLKDAKAGSLIIGSESHGVRSALQEKVTGRITIPGEAGAESLNASIAAGILLYAWSTGS